MATIRRAGFGSVFEVENEKVGIGTDNPDERLHIKENNNTPLVLKIENNSTNEARAEFWKWSAQYGSGIGFWPGNADLRIRTMSPAGNEAGNIVFEVESDEKMRINENVLPTNPIFLASIVFGLPNHVWCYHLLTFPRSVEC